VNSPRGNETKNHASTLTTIRNIIMKLNALAFVALVFVPPSTAQYFSAGWIPGQVVPTAVPSASSFKPETTSLYPSRRGESRFSLSKILSAGPIGHLFESLGINITERLEAAQANSEIWDERIPLITDENYNNDIVNEALTEEEAKDRVWFLIM
jgi:hypothetical protein